MFSKTYNNEVDEIITITDKNYRTLEIEDKVIWHCLLIDRNDTLFYRTTDKEICSN